MGQGRTHSYYQQIQKVKPTFMTDQNIKINSVKLERKGEKVIIGYRESAMVKSDDEKTCHDPVHPDFYDAIQKLRPHLAMRTSIISAKQIADEKELEKYEVTGYSFGGKEGNEGVTITGMRKNDDGQSYTLNSPFTRIGSEEGKGYVLLGQLLTDIEGIEKEVGKYLFEGKKKQPSLFNEETGSKKKTTIKVLPEESQEEKDEKVLSHLRNGVGHANPEAMKRVKEMDNEKSPEDVVTETVGALVEEQRQTLRGRGKRKGK
jgi:hypothetical protein